MSDGERLGTVQLEFPPSVRPLSLRSFVTARVPVREMGPLGIRGDAFAPLFLMVWTCGGAGRVDLFRSPGDILCVRPRVVIPAESGGSCGCQPVGSVPGSRPRVHL